MEFPVIRRALWLTMRSVQMDVVDEVAHSLTVTKESETCAKCLAVIEQCRLPDKSVIRAYEWP